MSGIPDEVVQLVAEQMLRRYDSQYNADHLSWLDFADDAREDLEAAAPLLRQQVLAEVMAQVEVWLDRFERDRNTSGYRDGKADGAAAIAGVISRLDSANG